MYNNPRITAQHLTQVIAIAAGGFHTVVAQRDGTVWTWSRSDAGQLGTGHVQGRGSYSSVPVQVPAMAHVIAGAAGGEHTLALRHDGTVWAGGENDCGQLSRGQQPRRAPRRDGVGLGRGRVERSRWGR
jgi:alpha-tubulin suppressor-like RCC1 family protein